MFSTKKKRIIISLLLVVSPYMAGNRKVSYIVESEKEETVASQTEIKTDRKNDNISAF